MSREDDHIQRRIVIEYGLRYVYLYMVDGAGKVVDDESFRQPYRLERQECYEEAKDIYDLLYDSLNDTINFPTAGNDDAGGKPE